MPTGLHNYNNCYQYRQDYKYNVHSYFNDYDVSDDDYCHNYTATMITPNDPTQTRLSFLRLLRQFAMWLLSAIALLAPLTLDSLNTRLGERPEGCQFRQRQGMRLH